MSKISKIYVSEWFITIKLWDIKGDSIVTQLRKRHTRHSSHSNLGMQDVMQNMRGLYIF